MPDGKPSVQQIVDASKQGNIGNGRHVQYEIVTYKGVEILMLKRLVENAVKITSEFTHDEKVIELAEELGIKLRRFSHTPRTEAKVNNKYK